MFRMFRFYSIASLVSIVGAAVVMAVLYRNIAVQGITTVAENNNLAMAQIALDPIRQRLADYLASASDNTAAGEPLGPLPREIADAIDDLMRNAHVKRIKIYNRNGTVMFSTKTSQIGGDQENNEGFVSAMRGRPAVELIYRDTFNMFDEETEEDNLVQSYIPVRRRPSEPVVGVFELYSDVNSLVADAERTQMKIIVLTAVTLAALYGVLLMIVRRARNVIYAQQQTIREKTAILEELSQRNLRREELDRKKFAGNLHEGLAQTLTAIKLAVESARDANAKSNGSDLLKSVVPALQGAISQTRAMAMDLRPPSLDDLGLAATIAALCREFRELHPQIRITQEITVPDSLVPSPLQIVVYRNVDAALKIIGDRRGATDALITLERQGRKLTLAIEANGEAIIPGNGMSDLAADTESPLSAVRERTIISGGELRVARDEAGAMALYASWRL